MNNYTLDDLIKELMDDEDWAVPVELRQVLLPGLALSLFVA